ncbi:MAG: hypothetical protein ACI8YI_000505, partial [Paracoccaceae bacterium]
LSLNQREISFDLRDQRDSAILLIGYAVAIVALSLSGWYQVRRWPEG